MTQNSPKLSKAFAAIQRGLCRVVWNYFFYNVYLVSVNSKVTGVFFTDVKEGDGISIALAELVNKIHMYDSVRGNSFCIPAYPRIKLSGRIIPYIKCPFLIWNYARIPPPSTDVHTLAGAHGGILRK